MSVTLVGTGCGSLDNMTVEVRQALLEADLIIGAKRLIEGFPAEYTAERRAGIYAADICGMIRERMGSARKAGASDAGQVEAGAVTAELPSDCVDSEPRICVAFSGDSGFYSGTRSLLPLLEEAGIEAQVLPGISSIQVFAARLRQSWQDWLLMSAHGTDCDAVTAVMQGRPVFFLTGGKLTPTEICGQLAEAGLGALPVVVGERLTYEDERIVTGTAADFAKAGFAPLSVMLAQPARWAGDLTPGIPDEAFIRGGVPMTKETVRAAILGHLQARPADTVWDVGAGTGSVSVELAMKAKAGRVYAIERDEEGYDLIRRNREKFGVWNLRPVDGPAPEALEDLPAPDKVFIGGSGGHLSEIIAISLEKNPAARICVSAIVLETMQEAVQVMMTAGMEVRIAQVAVSTARKIGKGAGGKHMLMAGNPIFIVTGERTAEEENPVSEPALAEAENTTSDGSAVGIENPAGGRDA